MTPPTKPLGWAEELAENIAWGWRFDGDDALFGDHTALVPRIAAVLIAVDKKAREETIEACAELLSNSADHTHFSHERKLLDHHAGMIRALLEIVGGK